jgi:hypothetical protein
MHDCAVKGRYATKLTSEAVMDIRLRFADGSASLGALAHEYGVTKENVSLVVKRKAWKHVA